MRNEVRDRVYSRYLFGRDKCGRRELICRDRGTIAIRNVVSVMSKSLAAACSGLRVVCSRSRDHVRGRLPRAAQRCGADSEKAMCAARKVARR
ncbi:hypothetical protein [Burkholderia diffusa]|uniref:hypothetical protein n=1 Tax=Burkholderia diffusa TaxID=488732 RepID=UPI0012D8724B|nr:hypothetical protein [Burkholderia diffusa]